MADKLSRGSEVQKATINHFRYSDPVDRDDCGRGVRLSDEKRIRADGAAGYDRFCIRRDDSCDEE